jgi:hypothetical protein
MAAGLPWHAALLAWVLAVPLWFITKFLLVLAHEGGHALMGVALLNRVDGIRLNSGGGGGTGFKPAPIWLFAIPIAIAGYVGPSVFGLGASWLLLHGEPAMVIWGSMVFLVLMLIAVRGLVGWVVVPALLVVLFQIATKADPRMLTLSAYVWTWFLLIGAVQRMIVYVGAKTYLAPKTDTARLQGMTLVPSEIWSVLLLLATTAALVWGGSMLLRMPVSSG